MLLIYVKLRMKFATNNQSGITYLIILSCTTDSPEPHPKRKSLIGIEVIECRGVVDTHLSCTFLLDKE